MASKDRTTSAATEEEAEEITDLSNSDVVTKYRLAADIANNTLNGVIDQIKPGAKVVDICKVRERLKKFPLLLSTFIVVQIPMEEPLFLSSAQDERIIGP